jgi:hypothetical protein
MNKTALYEAFLDRVGGVAIVVIGLVTAAAIAI